MTLHGAAAADRRYGLYCVGFMGVFALMIFHVLLLDWDAYRTTIAEYIWHGIIAYAVTAGPIFLWASIRGIRFTSLINGERMRYVPGGKSQPPRLYHADGSEYPYSIHRYIAEERASLTAPEQRVKSYQIYFVFLFTGFILVNLLVHIVIALIRRAN